jgi:hypothetical protein
MQPDYKYLIEKTGIEYPIIGFYDTPDLKPFKPYIDTDACVFAYFKLFLKGKYIRLTRKEYGCGGAGKWLCNIETRTKEQYVKFLADDEGLKANHSLMREWLEYVKPYQQEYENLIIGALKESEYEYLKTATFFVNPDQLSILMIGAQLHSSPRDPAPVISPFGSGCMQLISLFMDLSVPQAIIGATDMAMRKYLPLNVLAFTVTKPMFKLLCNIGKNSYLEKSFIKGLKKARSI